MVRSLLSVACLMAFLASSQAQDPIFSQFYATPLQINPGFAGHAFAPRFGLAYRNQWPGFNNAWRTYSFFYEQSLERLNSGIGFCFEGDNAGAGILKTNRFSAIYAYNLKVSEGLDLRLGIEAGMHQTALDWEKLVFPDDLDPIAGPIDGSNSETRPENLVNTKLDVSSGLLLKSEKFWLGTSLKHLNTPNQGFTLSGNNLTRGLPIRYAFHGGMELVVNKGNKLRPPSFISPNFLFLSQGPYKQLNFGAYASVGSIYGGMWFRHTFQNPDAAILLVGLREGVFKLGLSYDVTVSKLAGRSGGAYEISMAILLDKDEILQKKRRDAQVNDCFKMFH